MLQSVRFSRALVATLALSVIAGCAMQSSSHLQTASDHGSESPGARYQIYFDTNKIEISDRGQMIVRKVADVVADNETARLTVIGKTDRVGEPSANMALSRQRADQVRDALAAAGVPLSHIDTSWTGEGRQEVATANGEAEERNRVVDITVVERSR